MSQAGLRWNEEVDVMKRKSMKQLQQSIGFSQDGGELGRSLRDKVYWLL